MRKKRAYTTRKRKTNLISSEETANVNECINNGPLNISSSSKIIKKQVNTSRKRKTKSISSEEKEKVNECINNGSLNIPSSSTEVNKCSKLEIPKVLSKKSLDAVKTRVKRKTNNLNSDDSDTEDEYIDENDKEWVPYKSVVKESLRKILRLRQLPDYEKISKLLNESESLSYKRKKSLNTFTYKHKKTSFWNTYSYLLIQIEKCISNKDWNNLTSLLIYLTSAPKTCEPLLLKAAIINFLVNPTSEQHQIIEGYLKECYSCRTEDDINDLLTKLFHITPKILNETDAEKKEHEF